jgi:hypothetical protein
VTFDYDYEQSEDDLTVTMTGGESFDPARVEFQVDGNGSSASNVDAAGNFPVGASATSTAGTPINSNSMDGDTVTAGDSIEFDLTGDDSSSTTGGTGDFELSIIFTSEDGGTSSEIGGTTGPDA